MRHNSNLRWDEQATPWLELDGSLGMPSRDEAASSTAMNARTFPRARAHLPQAPDSGLWEVGRGKASSPGTGGSPWVKRMAERICPVM